MCVRASVKVDFIEAGYSGCESRNYIFISREAADKQPSVFENCGKAIKSLCSRTPGYTRSSENSKQLPEIKTNFSITIQVNPLE